MAQGYHDSDVIFTEESLIGFIKSIHDNIRDNYHFVSTREMAWKRSNNINFNDDETEISNVFPAITTDPSSSQNTGATQEALKNAWNRGLAGCICIINYEIEQDENNRGNGRYRWIQSGDWLRFSDTISYSSGQNLNDLQHGATDNNLCGTFRINRNNTFSTVEDWVQIKGFSKGNFSNKKATTLDTNKVTNGKTYVASDELYVDSLGNSYLPIANAYLTNANITDAHITNLKSTLSSDSNITIGTNGQLVVNNTADASRSANGVADPAAGTTATSVSGSINTMGGIAAALSIKGCTVHAAVFNDYAECRKTISLSPGHVVIDKDDGSLVCSQARLQPGAQVISDTYGNLMGETEDCQTPIAVAGRVLVYPYQNRENYHAGMAVCSASDGTVDIMTREEIRDYPDCIVGIVSEIPQYEKWGSNQVDVDGRIWIKVK